MNEYDVSEQAFKNGYKKGAKEFAERFEEELGEEFIHYHPYVGAAIDNLAKELVENS